MQRLSILNITEKKANKFIEKNLLDIIYLAENPIDCLGDMITNKYASTQPIEKRIGELVSCIYGDILRKEQKWYRHPRWHIWHWKIQIHPLQKLKRRYWDKCCKCGKRGFYNDSAMGNWSGDAIWHQKCDTSLCIPDTKE